jgi:methionyl-tRNA formyltransferase
MLRTAFAGTPEFAVPTLKALHTHPDIQLECVLTQPDRPRGRGQRLSESAVKQCATSLNLPVHQPESLKTEDALQWFQTLQLDVLVVVAYGQILTPAILDTPRFGCVNVHASLLPRWRGAAPLQRAIEAGDTTTGVTIMQMEPGLDTGPILATAECPISDSTTTGQLQSTLADAGGPLLTQTILAFAAGEITPKAQPTEGVTYAAKISTTDARIDWATPSERLIRQIHAFNPVPGAYCYANDTRFKIFRVEAASTEIQGPPGRLVKTNDQILVKTGSGTLRILECQLAGSKRLLESHMIQSNTGPWVPGCLLTSETA